MLYIDSYDGLWSKLESGAWVLVAAKQAHLNVFNITLKDLPYQTDDVVSLKKLGNFRAVEFNGERFQFPVDLKPGDKVTVFANKLSIQALACDTGEWDDPTAELTIVGKDPYDHARIIYSRHYSITKERLIKAIVDEH